MTCPAVSVTRHHEDGAYKSEVLELLNLYDVIQLGTGDLEVRADEVVQLVPSLGHLRLRTGKSTPPLH
jgi:hypothetical protein